MLSRRRRFPMSPSLPARKASRCPLRVPPRAGRRRGLGRLKAGRRGRLGLRAARGEPGRAPGHPRRPTRTADPDTAALGLPSARHSAGSQSGCAAVGCGRATGDGPSGRRGGDWSKVGRRLVKVRAGRLRGRPIDASMAM